MTLTFYDACGGIGAFRIAFENAGFKCAGYCDIDKFATSVYNYKFGEKHEPIDIRELSGERIPDHDIFIAGFPCQPFSTSGRRNGFQDTEKGNVFFEIERIIRCKAPRMVLLENVEGLCNQDGGRALYYILNSLRKNGYMGCYQVINSRYKVPQNRPRIYIVGHIGTKPPTEILPIEGFHCISSEEAGSKQTRRTLSQSPDISSCIDSRYGTLRNAGETYILHNIYGGFKEKSPRVTQDIVPAIRTPKGGGHLPVIAINHHYRSETREGTTTKGGTGLLLSEDIISHCLDPTPHRLVIQDYLGSKERMRTRAQDMTYTLDTTGRQCINEGTVIRRFTPLECERLMGLPDNHTKYGIFYRGSTFKMRIKGKRISYMDGDKLIFTISDSQRYKQIGNSVVVPVVQILAERIKKFLSKN